MEAPSLPRPMPIETGVTRAVPAPRHEIVLAVLLGLEIAVFGMLGKNFASFTNFFEIVRLSTEIGLLALALTPVIVSGGIDLSVGSMMGLAAVTFGLCVKVAGLTIGSSIAITLAVGAAGGGLNALLVTRLRIPPPIVTLGTYSLFRGLAEGLTAGVKNFTSFKPEFLKLGQGYFFFDLLPMQLPILVGVALGYFVLLQRSTAGRALYAIGFSPEGSRYAG